MRRSLLNFLTGLSLLLCVAVAVFWVRSIGHTSYIAAPCPQGGTGPA